MYKRFFHMAREPFAIHPSPEKYFPSKSHGHAWYSLKQSLISGEPYIMVSGEYGVGKTLLCLKLCGYLQSQPNYRFVLIPTPVSYALLLNNIVKKLGISELFRACETVTQFEGMLFSLYSSEKIKWRITLVIDDLQDYSREKILQLKRLASFHYNGFYPFHIICFSHMSFLDEARKEPAFIPFLQRFKRHFRIQNLEKDELKEYIYFCLLQAGAKGRPFFETAVLRYIAEKSNGIPRLVNNLCDKILLEAVRLEKDRIDLWLAKKALDDEFLEQPQEGTTLNGPASDNHGPASENQAEERKDTRELDLETLLTKKETPEETIRRTNPSSAFSNSPAWIKILVGVNAIILVMFVIFLFFGLLPGHSANQNTDRNQGQKDGTMTSGPAPSKGTTTDHADQGHLTIGQLKALETDRQAEEEIVGPNDRPYSFIVSSNNSLGEIPAKIERLKNEGLDMVFVVEDKSSRSPSDFRWAIGTGSYSSAQDASTSSLQQKFPKAVLQYLPYSILVSVGDDTSVIEDVRKMLLAEGYYPWKEYLPNGKTRLLLGAYKTREEASDRFQLLRQEGIKGSVVNK